MIEVKVKATVLSAASKPWEMDGRSGVSHKVRMNIGGEVYKGKVDEAEIASYQKLVGKEVDMLVQFTSEAERLDIRFLRA